MMQEGIGSFKIHGERLGDKEDTIDSLVATHAESADLAL
jgi:hypothetical protein